MAQEHDPFPETDEAAAGTPAEPARAPAIGPVIGSARRWSRAARGPVLVVSGLAVLALGAAWLGRKEIADNVIAGQLESLGLPARYEIVSIGPSEQVIRNLSIGDPARPDLFVEELRVATRLSWGFPGIGRITVVRPRLYGSWRGGKVSFGSLDKALFTGKGGPFEMPDLDVKVVDGRALVDGDMGRIGVKLTGEGALRGGFAGELAAIAPGLRMAGCAAGRTTLYGTLTTASAKPRFKGPVRMAQLACPDRQLALSQAGVQLDLTLDEALDGGEGDLGLAAGPARQGLNRMAGLTASGRFTYRKDSLSATYTATARGLATPQARLASLTFDGRARSAQGLSRFDLDGDLAGKGVALGDAPGNALLSVQRSGEGTLIAPLAAQVRAALAREMRGSSLDANLIVRNSPDGLSLVVTRGSLRGGSGASLVALSRMQALIGPGGAPRVTGNFTTGGKGLPQVWGRMETSDRGRLTMQVSMPDYRAGTAVVGVPRLALVQDRDGALGFTGHVLVSGDLPGGNTRNLRLPVEGRWGADGALALWRGCTDLSFDGLRLANLSIDKRRLTLCPARGGAIVQGRPGALVIAAGATSLDVSGRLGETPIRIASGPLGFAMNGSNPGVLKAGALRVTLGPEQTASRFAVSRLDARIGKDVAGTFDEADIGLYAVPLDMKQAAGQWRYAGGVVSIDGGRFTLVDRQPVARFQPLVARDATLRLADNRIVADAMMREPGSDREIVRANIVHDLGTGGGHADLAVPGIVFDEKVQADTLSRMLLGVVSGLRGQLHGNGRIDWDARGVTSSGRFATDGVDFAAAFGPVSGASGEVVFTDLLGFVTAPGQKLRLASVNPGIEVTDGTLSFEMKPGYLLQINGAQWPFMDGTLTLEPAQMRIGVAETRNYTLRVTGLNAATFVQHLELSNINASGVFDGELPLVFDQNGGRIENGYLRSRAPGGNVSYIGALTYKDLSAMGNFAFDALKSVDYRQMEIGLGGSLSGEIVTRISFDGLSQGAGTKQNFITKQVAKLPIRFIVNLKAPFFSLFGSMRSLYDPAYVTDPRVLGLLDGDGHRRENGPDATVNVPQPPSTDIQPPVSEKAP